MTGRKSGIDFGLYLVTDRLLSGCRPLDKIVRDSVAGGVTIVQLREKDAAAREFLEQAFILRQATSELDIPFISTTGWTWRWPAAPMEFIWDRRICIAPLRAGSPPKT